MRKLLILPLIVAVSGIAGIAQAATTLKLAASSAGLPRYSSVTEANAGNLVFSFRNLGKTEYVNCTLPAPIECGKPADTQKPIWGSLSGTAYRNEAGTLQVTSAQDASGSLQLVAYAMKKGEWTKVREWKAVGGATRVMVAGDGKGFAVFMANGTVVRYGIEADAPLSTATYAASGSAMTLSSTGRYLAFYRPGTASRAERSYFVADLTTGKEVSWSEPVVYWDLVSEDNRVFSFSPDDASLVLRSDKDGWQKPYLVNLKAGLPTVLAPTLLFARPYAVADLVFIDNDRLAVVANRDSATAWGLYALNVRTLDIVKVSDGASYGVSLKRFGDYVSFAKTTPGGVSGALYNVRTGTVTLAESLAKTTIPAGAVIPAPNAIKTTSASGGYAVWEPTTKTKATPIVIWLHGGPYRQISTAGYHPFNSYGNLDWMLEQTRLSGAIVAKVDYPGSYGYGRTYAESLTGKVGLSDVDAVRQAIASLRATYGANAPVYVVGNSYGGYLAQKSLVELGSQVAGIYSISGVTDWESLIASNPAGIFGVQFRGAPSALNNPLYLQAKLILKIGSIGAQKIYLAHGDADTSVPSSQTTLLDQLLRIEKKNVTTTFYPGENHVFSKPANIADLCKKAIELVGGKGTGRCAI